MCFFWGLKYMYLGYERMHYGVDRPVKGKRWVAWFGNMLLNSDKNAFGIKILSFETGFENFKCKIKCVVKLLLAVMSGNGEMFIKNINYNIMLTITSESYRCKVCADVKEAFLHFALLICAQIQQFGSKHSVLPRHEIGF